MANTNNDAKSQKQKEPTKPKLLPNSGVQSKQDNWKKIETYFDQLTDALGSPLDVMIKEPVIALNLLGFKTRQSCEGHLNWGDAAPWIDIEEDGTDEMEKVADAAFDLAEKAAGSGKNNKEVDDLFIAAHALRKTARKPGLKLAKKLMKYLSEFYSNRKTSYDKRLNLTSIGRFFRIQSQGYFLQDIAVPKTKKQKLADYQEEMRDFSQFLKYQYFLT